MAKPATIAIDGPGGAGKNAVGRLLARRLGYRFVDTGAMYRALTWLALKEGVSLEDEEALSHLAARTRINLDTSPNGEGAVQIDGQEATEGLRSSPVEEGVSLVSRVAGVRESLVAQQRRLAQGGGVVMVGRDIGTVVLPQAELKVYLDAPLEERARRRYLELQKLGQEPNYQAILDQLRRRDRLDSERSVSPLRPAPDAKGIDTDGLALEEVVARVLSLWSDP